LGINLEFSGTGIGWLGSLIWACGAVHRSATGSKGGESELNMFVRDPQVVRITSDPTTMPAPSIDVDEIAAKMLRLKSLNAAGAIT